MEQEAQKKVVKENYIPFSERMKYIRSIRDLYSIQTILQEFNSDDDNIMYYLVEQTERNIDVYCSMNNYRFNWNPLRTLRVIKRLVKKGLVIKINCCSECGKEYKRIPEICENPDCSEMLIQQKGLSNNKLKQPRFLIRLTEKGINYVNERINGFHVALRLFDIRINNIRRKRLNNLENIENYG